MAREANGKLHTAIPDEPSAQALLIDDLLRRKLRIGDPRNAKEISEALRTRYSPAAARIDAETRGTVVEVDGPKERSEPTADTAGQRAYRRAVERLSEDLDTILKDPGNRDWVDQLTGWKSKLLVTVRGAASAATEVQDAAQRSRAFLSISQIADYARVARLIGLANDVVLPPYRRLARSLDSAGAALRILMGESLDASGLGEGGLILEVPVVDARERRGTVIRALRRLVGTGGDTSDKNAPNAYDWLLRQLAAAPELRALLREQFLAEALDGLLVNVGRQDSSALRVAASTAPLTLAQLERLQGFSEFPGAPASEALSGFFAALGLFIGAFAAAGSGARLVEFATAAPLGTEQLENGTEEGRNLRELIRWRGQLAREIDTWALEEASAPDRRRLLRRFDRALRLTDRAVDLFLEGTGERGHWGPEEHRAAIYVYLAREIATAASPLPDPDAKQPFAQANAVADRVDKVLADQFAKDFVKFIYGNPNPPRNNADLDDVLFVEDGAERALRNLARSLSPRSLYLL